MKKYFEMKETLFLDLDVFEMDFIPEIFRFREAPVTKIVSAIQSGLQGNCPVNLVIKDPSETGILPKRPFENLLLLVGRDSSPGCRNSFPVL